MNPEYYFQKGLRLIVASAVIFALIVLFSAMVSRGFPFWRALVLLVPAGLCVAGLYYFSMGTSADLSERFLPSFPSRAAQTEEISTVEEELERVAVDATDEKSLDPTVAISEVIPAIRTRRHKFSKMHFRRSTPIRIKSWVKPLMNRIG